MFKRSTIMTAATALILGSSAAVAQSTDAEIATMIEAWVNEQGGELPDLVQGYGDSCLTAAAVMLPDTAKEILVAAGNMEAGLDALEIQDTPALEAFLGPMEACIMTLYVGEIIVPWVAVEGEGESQEVLDEVTICLMDAILPLDTASKATIINTTEEDDFENAVELLMEQQPTLTEGLEDRLEACF